MPALYRSLERRIKKILINLLPTKFFSVLTEFIQVSLLMPESGQGLFKWIVRKGKSRVAFSLISGFESGRIPNRFKFLLVKLKKKKVNPKARMQMDFQPDKRSLSFPEAEPPLSMPRRSVNMRSVNPFDYSRGFSSV